MAKVKDIKGQKFGRLLVIDRDVSKEYPRPYWNCICECRSTPSIRGSRLISGNTRSCGCLQKEEQSARVLTHGHSLGSIRSPTYKTYQSMKTRCLNPKNEAFHNYGGRGILIDESWIKDFSKFLEDMGERPRGTTLDRIDNNGPYTKDNCKWSTYKEQGNNTRVNRLIEYLGETKNLTQWATQFGISVDVLWRRLNVGKWSIEKAFTTTVGKRRPKNGN